MSHLNAFPIFMSLATTYGISRDCPDMVNQAMGLGIESKQPLIWSQLQSDCCTTAGVTCTSQRVTGIDWGDMRLNGSINGTALPTGLQILNLGQNILSGNVSATMPAGLLYLILRNNQLTGNIPESLPTGLQGLYLSHNQLTGNIPAILPTGLQYLLLDHNIFTGNIPQSLPMLLELTFLDNNQLTGNIPAALPTGLYHLALHNNRLTGNIPVVLPTALQFLYLGSNQLAGSIPTILPAGLQSLYLHNNQLTGNIPSTLPAGLQYLYLYNNQVTGVIKIGYPINLHIQNNLITDVIIAETASLVSCDVSNNPLLASPHISNLTMCVQIGLYSASLLTTTTSIAVSYASSLLAATTTKIAVSYVSPLLTALGTIDMHSVSSKVLQKYGDGAGISSDSMSTNIKDSTGSHYSFRVILHTLTLVEIVTQFFKLLGSSLVLIFVIYKTPWKREFKSKMRKRNKSKDDTPHSNWAST